MVSYICVVVCFFFATTLAIVQKMKINFIYNLFISQVNTALPITQYGCNTMF